MQHNINAGPPGAYENYTAIPIGTIFQRSNTDAIYLKMANKTSVSLTSVSGSVYGNTFFDGCGPFYRFNHSITLQN